jgi:hypothetical protein
MIAIKLQIPPTIGSATPPKIALQLGAACPQFIATSPWLSVSPGVGDRSFETQSIDGGSTGIFGWDCPAAKAISPMLSLEYT